MMTARLTACLLILALVLPLPGIGATTAHATTGWYIAFGIGASKAGTMKQAGNNDDTTCYPDDDCGHLPDMLPTGYRWFYDLHPDTDAAFELAVGYGFRLFRLELATTRQTLGIDQQFVGGSYLDGSRAMPAADSFYTVDVKTGVDDLTLHTLALNAYADLPIADPRLTPYLGLGLGLTFAKLSRLHYESAYALKEPECPDTAACANPEGYEEIQDIDPAMYNGRQHIDLTDTVPSVHFHLGADYRIRDTLLIGLKVSYNLAGDMSQEDAYEYHAIAGMTSHTEISGIRYWAVLLNLKWEL